MVIFKRDSYSEMLCVEVDKKCIFEGSYWDFGIDDAIHILERAGVEVDEEAYDYE